MDNNNRVAHGRFLNVKPAVGLLTSTARTFIQDGVTTEYATQVLGKTIDNGRLYAQLLTKSSRVVYSNGNNNNEDDIHDIETTTITTTTHTQSNAYNQQIIPTQVIGTNKYDLLTAIDDKDNETTKYDNENIMTFIKNTDYISPNSPTVKAYHVQSTNLVDFNAPNGDEIEFELLPQSLAQVQHLSNENGEVRQSFSVSESSSTSANNKNGDKIHNNNDAKVIVEPEKVKSIIDLPTFTIPSGYTFEGIDSVYQHSDSTSSEEQNDDNDDDSNSFSGSPQAINLHENRVGKQLQNANIPIVGLIEDEKPQLTSVTYYGFADFTTIVGNTVIIFSPSTASSTGTGKVTSIKGEATLQVNQIDPTPTIEQPIIPSTRYIQQNVNLNRKSKAEEKSTIITPAPIPTTTTEQITTEQIPIEFNENITDTAEEQSEEELEQKSSILAKEQNTLKYSAVLPSVLVEASEQNTITENESTSTPSIQIVSASESKSVTLSIPSNEDISKIFASLAAKDQEKSTTTEESTHETVTGATTIFFEDDPFLLIESTSSSIASSSTVYNLKTNTVTEHYENTLTTTEESVDVTTQATTTESSSELSNDDKFAITTENGNYDEQTTTTSHPQFNKNENIEHNVESDDESVIQCPDGFSIKPSTTVKTLTYLTTFFIPIDDNDESTTTSIQANNVLKTDVVFECSALNAVADEELIAPSSVQQIQNTENVRLKNSNKKIELEISARNKLFNRNKEITTTNKPITTTEEPTTTEAQNENNDETEMNTTTENASQNVEGNTIEAIESSMSMTTTTESANDSDEEQEIELIYKTLYTTYTYLTTFFHESTSSISSRKEVVTNIVTSTLDLSLIKSDSALADLVASMSSEQIQPTKSFERTNIENTAAIMGSDKERPVSIEDIFDDSVVESNINNNQATPVLRDSSESDAKTYYTTYTYYTTIFVDGETDILSRTEVYTNFIGQSIKPTKLVEEDRIFSTNLIAENKSDNEVTTEFEEILDNNVIQPNYSTMLRLVDTRSQENPPSTENNFDENVTTETPPNELIKKSNSSSTSSAVKGQNNPKRVVENIRKQLNNILLEDQISSESNNEDILPSSTLLLQTSFTTFTYYTTKYIDDTSTVLSRLETVTNVVTETLSPTQTIVLPANDIQRSDDEILPTTYFTTFTYWTTLYKDGEVVTTSREKIVSNVISPTATNQIDEVLPTTKVGQNKNEPNVLVVTPSIVEPVTLPNEESESSSEVKATASNEPTTYFTTYTYFTTSYIGDETILK